AELLPARADGGVPLETFEAGLRRGGARVVAVSWVQYGYGYRLDLAALGELCQRYGALLCVDAIQGLGVIPAEFARWGVALAAADGHKWMLGPEGIGLAYVAAEHRHKLRVTQPGWNCVPHRGDFGNRDVLGGGLGTRRPWIRPPGQEVPGHAPRPGGQGSAARLQHR